MKIFFLVYFLSLSVCLKLNAQYTMTANTGTTITVSDGTLYLGSYLPNNTYTLTICSDNPSFSHIGITFDAWTQADSVNYCVYDGVSTSSPLIGCNEWGIDQTVAASIPNESGCLTIVFFPNYMGSEIGGRIKINSVFPCQTVLSTVEVTDPPATFSDGKYYIDLCYGEELVVQGSGIYENLTYSQSDATSEFYWTFGDGSTGEDQNMTHLYTEPGAYDLNLMVTDEAGCNSINNIGYRVRVANPPDYTAGAGTYLAPYTVCQGELIHLVGNVSAGELVSLNQTEIADTSYIPDGHGLTCQSSILINEFSTGQILEDIDDLCGICANIEHSFLGDLQITITCPHNTITGTSTTVVLESQSGGGVFLGQPIDDLGGGGPGIGWEYCWTIPGDADFMQDMGTTAPGYTYLPSGNYITSDPLDPLVGCELNGEWMLTVTDHWPIDDGYIFSWWLCFDPGLGPEQWSFQNTYPTAFFTPGGVGGAMVDPVTAIYTQTGAATTNQTFYYTVVDDFGCAYDTALNVVVLGDAEPVCEGMHSLSINNGDVLEVCDFEFESGNYSPLEEYSVTFCSSDPINHYTSLTFESFIVEEGTVCIHDGMSISAPVINCGDFDLGETFFASLENSTGCLTLSFDPSIPYESFTVQVGCGFPCQEHDAAISSSTPSFEIEDGYYYIDACMGIPVHFVGTGVYPNVTYPQSDGTSTFLWDFGDGGTAAGINPSHIYSTPGCFDIDLTVIDTMSCPSNNIVHFRVRISGPPDFSEVYSIPEVACQTEIVTLYSNIQGFEFIDYFEPYVISDTIYIPDGGDPNVSILEFDYFGEGNILEDINDLCGICAVMEHSYINDITIEITCPYNTLTGQPTTVVLEDQHGGGTFLGVPIDDAGGGGPGVGWEYCWTIPADADYLQDMGDYADLVSTLPSGSYITSEPLDPLVGCVLDGEWTLTITDYWEIDDGYLFSWWICFEEDILPPDYEFHNTYPVNYWTALVAGGEMISDNTGTYSGFGDSTTVQPFFLYVTDDFGCNYDTAIYVTFLSDSIAPCNSINIDETNFFSENEYGFYLKTYPNPIDDFISIEYHTDELMPVSIMLLDPLGKKLYQNRIKESMEVQKVTISEIEGLSPGTYFLVVKYKETDFVKKVIVF